jgi:hypothetical protein
VRAGTPSAGARGASDLSVRLSVLLAAMLLLHAAAAALVLACSSGTFASATNTTACPGPAGHCGCGWTAGGKKCARHFTRFTSSPISSCSLTCLGLMKQVPQRSPPARRWLRVLLPLLLPVRTARLRLQVEARRPAPTSATDAPASAAAAAAAAAAAGRDRPR